MRASLIDPYRRVVSAVEYGGTLAHIRELVFGVAIDGALDFRRLGRDQIAVDDFGLRGDLSEQAYFAIEGFGTPLAGRALVIGVDAEGEDCAPSLSVELLRSRVIWLTPVEFVARFNRQREEAEARARAQPWFTVFLGSYFALDDRGVVVSKEG